MKLNHLWTPQLGYLSKFRVLLSFYVVFCRPGDNIVSVIFRRFYLSYGRNSLYSLRNVALQASIKSLFSMGSIPFFIQNQSFENFTSLWSIFQTLPIKGLNHGNVRVCRIRYQVHKGLSKTGLSASSNITAAIQGWISFLLNLNSFRLRII